MQLIITKRNLGLWAASYIQKRVNESRKKPFVLGLPTGGTVLDMYAALAELVKNGKMSFKDVVTFNMDEYATLPPEHDQSYHYYMKHNLFDKVDIRSENVHILNGMAPDLDEECRRYEAAITQAGGVDLGLGGVGRNGHLAFNEPGSAFDSRTRVMELTCSTRAANSRFFGNDPARVPERALTVGIGTVLDAKELLFLASGDSKAEAVARLAQGGVTRLWPITALKTHPKAILLADEAAASALDGELKKQLAAARLQNPDGDWVLHI